MFKNEALPPALPAVLHFDGSCRPNPGPMGIGYTIRLNVEGQAGVDAGALITPVRVGAFAGKGTNNEAEYRAMIAGLRHALALGFWSLSVKSDSLLVVKQSRGEWDVKDRGLRRFVEEGRELLSLFASVEIEHIRREENGEADELSRQMVYEAPSLPLPPKWGHVQRVFHPWQACALRAWWGQGHRNMYLLARIFGVSPGSVEQVVTGHSYRTANWDGKPLLVGDLPAVPAVPKRRSQRSQLTNLVGGFQNLAISERV